MITAVLPAYYPTLVQNTAFTPQATQNLSASPAGFAPRSALQPNTILQAGGIVTNDVLLGQIRANSLTSPQPTLNLLGVPDSTSNPFQTDFLGAVGTGLGTLSTDINASFDTTGLNGVGTFDYLGVPGSSGLTTSSLTTSPFLNEYSSVAGASGFQSRQLGSVDLIV